jgi:hypothetical protein
MSFAFQYIRGGCDARKRVSAWLDVGAASCRDVWRNRGINPLLQFAINASELAPRILAARPALFVLLALALTVGARTADRPNLLVILTDDHGYGDVSAFRPQGDVRTPNIDRLAAEGMTFTAMRANCTVCSPSRAAILTGQTAPPDQPAGR